MEQQIQRIKETYLCFKEQFAKGKVPTFEEERMKKYKEIMSYLDYLYKNYEKMGILK